MFAGLPHHRDVALPNKGYRNNDVGGRGDGNRSAFFECGPPAFQPFLNSEKPSMPAHDIRIAREDILSPRAQSLIAELNAELSALYPEAGANHFRLDAPEVAEGKGAFLMAFLDETAVGCGAIRLVGEGVAEIKRMYTNPQTRGHGVGKRILETLEKIGRELGAHQLVLETGLRQEAALRLYENSGFKRIPRYGEYTSSPLSICLGKDLRGLPSAISRAQ